MTDPGTNDPLTGVASYPTERYEGVDLTGLAAYALWWLQDRNLATTFENIVVTTFRMFPTKFSLEGYSAYPDAARVGRTLLQLGPKYRNWARGSVQKGFVLTESGLAKVRRISETLASDAPLHRASGTQRPANPRTFDLSKELRPIEASALFVSWRAGSLDSSNALEFLNMLGAYAYTPAKALRDRLAALENVANQVGRPDLVEFLQAVRKAFSGQLRDA